MKKELDIIIPIALDSDWPTFEDATESILELYSKYGFKKFALAAPYGGWRAFEYPPTEFFRGCAELFLRVKNELLPYNIECGWWIQTTLKSGKSEEFYGYVKENGSKSFFQNCPLDDAFIKRLSADIALFAAIAKPTFIITEDDYTVMSGCFCEHHLNEFAKRVGKYYSRGELLDIFSSDTEEGYMLLKRWRELSLDSLVTLARTIRKEVDKKTPEISIGYMQSGSTDIEGYSTEEIARALAGPVHTPFSRIYGAPYCGIATEDIPKLLYHALYSVQHVEGDFRCYHESDPFPHTRFFVAGKHMKTIMANAYSFGMVGSTFNVQQLLDCGNEEYVYAKMFSHERKRFNALYNALQNCTLTGVGLCYDPFWNTADKSVSDNDPLWLRCVSRFGIPYTTKKSSVAFWDVRQAKYSDEETVLEHLSNGLFLDSAAAKILCERGFGEYLGVEIGDDVSKEPLCYDLAAREIICKNFQTENKGKNMPAAHMFAMGRNGKLLQITVKNPAVEVISEEYTYKKGFVSPAMVRFKNKLGGKIVILGETLENNISQSLFNYRRKRLFEQMLLWCSDEYAFIREEPNLYIVVNVPPSNQKNDFLGIVTITNLSADTVSNVTIHLPKHWKAANKFYSLDIDGKWKELNRIFDNQELTLNCDLEYCEPMYLMIK